MAKQQAQQQMTPGQYFRVPNRGVRPRFVPEGGNKNIITTLSQGETTPMPTVKMDQADIVKGYLAVVTLAATFTPEAEHTVVPAFFFPANILRNIQLEYEATYSPVDLTGIMAQVMQAYRPAFSDSDGPGVMSLSGVLSNAVKPSFWGGFPAIGDTAAPGLANDYQLVHKAAESPWASPITGALSLTMYYEIPTSMLFDLYWPLDKTGAIVSPPLPRRVISPQYMSATTRNNVPEITVANPLALAGDINRLPMTSDSGGTSTATDATTAMSIQRVGWFPGNAVTAPPIDPWQYARQEMSWPTNGAGEVVIPLDSQVANQGQILSLVGYVYDPGANDGGGGVVPLGDLAELDLIYGSDVFIKNQSPAVNQYEWSSMHGFTLPAGFFGWDLALTDDGKLTNENALNTYIQAGCQVRITFKDGSQPGAMAQVYLGLESLKYVTQ